MNILPIEKQISAIAALTEGCSIRVTELLTGIHRDTIMRLGVRVGQGCAKLHSVLMRDLQINLIEVDEIWSYAGKKQRKTTKEDVANKGDQYVFTALDTTSKVLISYRVGDNTRAFAWDLRERITNTPTYYKHPYD